MKAATPSLSTKRSRVTSKLGRLYRRRQEPLAPKNPANRDWVPNSGHLRLGLFGERGHPKAHRLPPNSAASAIAARRHSLRRASLVVVGSRALTVFASASSTIAYTKSPTSHLRARSPLPVASKLGRLYHCRRKQLAPKNPSGRGWVPNSNHLRLGLFGERRHPLVASELGRLYRRRQEPLAPKEPRRSPSSLATSAGRLLAWPPLPLPSRAIHSQEPRRSWLGPDHLCLGLFDERGHPKARCLPPSSIASAVTTRCYSVRRAPPVVAASQALTFSACASSVIADTQKLTGRVQQGLRIGFQSIGEVEPTVL